MEPHNFARISVSALVLRLTTDEALCKADCSTVHATCSPCFAEIKLPGFPTQTASVPLLNPTANSHPGLSTPPLSRAASFNQQFLTSAPVSFYLDEPALKKLLSASCCSSSRRATMEVIVYASGCRQYSCFGPVQATRFGKFSVSIGSDWTAAKPLSIQQGWVSIGKGELHVSVTIEPDPRFVFEFDAEPERSPQIVHIQCKIRQPIFTCKFTVERSFRTSWPPVVNQEQGVPRKERKGWIIVLHDLSGVPVAAASMVTPFLPTSGSQYVTRSNPGAWLIMQSGSRGEGIWRPWGRLEAWRERGSHGLGCRFKLLPDSGDVTAVNSALLICESVLASNRGTFVIDTDKSKPALSLCASSQPLDVVSRASVIGVPVGGFVMKARIDGRREGKRLRVELAMRHISCMEDPAVFLALAAAVDLSVDACLRFNKKLGDSFSSNQL